MPVLIRGNPLLDVYDAGAFVNHRPAINLIGATVADNEALDRVDITVGPTAHDHTSIQDADSDPSVRTAQAAAADKVRIAVGGVARQLVQTASPHHQLTGDAQLTGHIGIGVAPSANVMLGLLDSGSVMTAGRGVVLEFNPQVSAG